MHKILTGKFFRAFFIFLLFAGRLFSQSFLSSEAELKKQADKYFIAENFEAALPDYSRLLSLYPKEPFYNYRFGVCLLLAGKEKANASTYLEQAIKDPKMPEEVWYFLGKSYMFNNDFGKAGDAFNQFKQVANSAKQKKYDVTESINNCISGAFLVKSRRNVVTVSSNEVDFNTFYNNYEFPELSGKIVGAAEQFLTPMDKEKMRYPVMFISNDKQTVFISSYGKKGENGKDLYIIRRTPDNQWSVAENLGSAINTTSDEDFPFLDRDGKTLYFSSRGRNSIGGYDIFRSTYDFNTRKWTPAENIGIPINTIGDDYLFVPEGGGKTATYATNAESQNNFISIKKIQLPSTMNEMLTISGVYLPIDQQVRRDARISILTNSGDGIITSVHTDPVTGKYELVLPQGETYMIVVEGGGYLPHAEYFELPSGMIDPDLKQVVKLNRQDRTEELTLQNYFASANSVGEPSKTITRSFSTNIDSSKMISVKINDQIVFVTPPTRDTTGSGEVTEKKVAIPTLMESTIAQDTIDKPEVKSNITIINTDEEFTGDSAKSITTDSSNSIEENESESEFSSAMTNEELAKIAYNDAQEMQDEADSLRREAASLKKIAGEKENLSIELKDRADADGLPADSSTEFNTQAENFHQESEEANMHALELESRANAREEEAKIAFTEANTMMKGSKKSPNSLATTGTSSKTTSNKNTPASSGKKNSDASTPLDKTTNLTTAATTPGSDSIDNSSVTKVDESEELSSKTLTSDSLASNEGKINEIEKLNGQSNSPADITSTTSPSENNQSEVIASSKSETNTGQDQQDNNSDNSIPANESSAMKVRSDSVASEIASNNHADNSTQDNNIVPEETKPVARLSTGRDSAAENQNATLTVIGNSVVQVEGNQEKKESQEKIAEQIAANETSDKKTEITVMNESSPVQQNQNSVPSDSIKRADAAIQNSAPINSANNNITGAENSSDSVAISTNNINDVKTSTKETATVSSNQDSTIMPLKERSMLHEDTLFAAHDTAKSNHSGPEINSEAKAIYQDYQTQLKHSNELTQEALNLQDEISELVPCPRRDSLIRASNDLTLQSVKEWQAALQKAQEARKIDSQIDYKMNVLDYRANHPGESMAMKEAADTVKQDFSLAGKGIETESDSAIIDSLNPEYANYSSIKKEIKNKQEETINYFADAVNLSKKSLEEKEQANALMDRAQMETDQKKKNQLMKQSRELKALSEKHEQESKEKFLLAQEQTRTVKQLRSDLAVVKDKVTKRNDVIASSETDKNLAIQSTLDEQKLNSAKAKKAPSKLSSGGGVDVFENENNKTMNAATFAMAERAKDETSVSEEDIEAVKFSNEDKIDFLRNAFSLNSLEPYNKKNPIPMNPSLPEGLVFKVQVGAFKKPIPSNSFNGLKPVSGETTRPGWIRYCVGMFQAFEPANLVKNELKKTGYKDAFVVAYYNGKRIDLNDAYVMLKQKENLTAYKEESAKELAMLHALNIRPDKSWNASNDRDVLAYYAKQPIKEALNYTDSPKGDSNADTETNGFTIQVGVYKSQKVPRAIASLSDLEYKKTRTGMYRFMTGKYDDREAAVEARRNIIKSGIKDAFVIPYSGGTKATEYTRGALTVMRNTPVAEDKNEKTIKTQEDNTTFADGRIVYKVQIGAFKNNIPYNAIESFLSIRDKGITRQTDDRGLHIFYAGEFTDFSSASRLREEITATGLTDAFVVALRNGKRIVITDDMKSVNR